jgi:hypothetical protein
MFAQHQRGEDQPRQRGAGRLDGGAVAERHQHEAGIGDHRLRRPRQHAHHQAAAPADATEVGDAVTQDERHQQQAGPQEAVQGQIGGRKADGDAMLGRDKTRRPAERGAGAAQYPDQDTGRPCRCRLRP